MPGIEKVTNNSSTETAQTNGTTSTANTTESQTNSSSSNEQQLPSNEQQNQQPPHQPATDNLLIQQDQINNCEEGREMSQTDRINRQLLKSFLDRMNTENFNFDKTNDDDFEEQNFDD